MKQGDIKYIYEIDSSLDLDEVIDSLTEELKLEKGILRYFSLSQDDLLEKELPISRLQEEALEASNNNEYPSIIFPKVEINVDDDKIEIVSQIKLDLRDIDLDNTIEK